MKESHDQDMLDSRQLEPIVIDISKENPCVVQTSNKGYLQNTHVSDNTSKTKQDELSLSPPSLNICPLIETEVNIETSDNIITGSLERKIILHSCTDSDPKAAAKKSISYESCLGGCEFSKSNELHKIYDNKASLHGVGYVKQYANIFRNGSSNTNAALLQQTSSKVSSLIRNSENNAAFKEISKLSPSIISSTNQFSRLAATF